MTGSLTCVVRIFFQPESQGWRNAVIILALQSFVNNWALSVSSWKAMVWYSNELRTTVAKTFHLFSLRYQKRIWERLVATFVFYRWQLCRLHSRSGHSLSFQLAFQDLQERKQWDFYIVFKAILPKFSGYNPICRKTSVGGSLGDRTTWHHHHHHHHVTNINHKGLQGTANEYAGERRIYKDLISKNNNIGILNSAKRILQYSLCRI